MSISPTRQQRDQEVDGGQQHRDHIGVLGIDYPNGVAVDGAGNVYIADTGNNAIKELPYAFVDPTPRLESPAAGNDALPVVLPATENLLAPFTPTSDQPWLTITGITNGVVSFSFTATTSNRTGYITLLGQTIPVTQGSLPYSLGTTALLEGPAREAIASFWLCIPAIRHLDGHGECHLAASQPGQSKRHRQHECGFQLRCQSGRDAHRHPHHRRPDAHRHPGRFNLCRGQPVTTLVSSGLN